MKKLLTKLLNRIIVFAGIGFLFYSKGKQAQKNKQLKAENEALHKQNEETIEIANITQEIWKEAQRQYPKYPVRDTDEHGNCVISHWVSDDK